MMADRAKSLLVFGVAAAAFAVAFMIGAWLLEVPPEVAHTAHLHWSPRSARPSHR
jgi:hypothetical protein